MYLVCRVEVGLIPWKRRFVQVYINEHDTVTILFIILQIIYLREMWQWKGLFQKLTWHSIRSKHGLGIVLHQQMIKKLWKKPDCLVFDCSPLIRYRGTQKVYISRSIVNYNVNHFDHVIYCFWGDSTFKYYRFVSLYKVQ